jgi:type II secretory ATPase GspE/PulE/Tfp pilus assembly ATPase PilB-like protein
MPTSLTDQYLAALAERTQGEAPTAVEIVDSLLMSAQAAGASDVHIIPESSGSQVCWRIDGVLHEVTRIGGEIAPNVVARLKVLAELLTYRTEVPQEGRVRHTDVSAGDVQAGPEHTIEMRLSTFPTLYGEKAVVRLFVGSGAFRRLDQLGLPAEILSGLGDLLLESGGVILVCGPAGSGKTTTIYAALREVVDKSRGERSLVSLEDPIEAVVSGVAQSQVNPAAGFDYEIGLKSLMRQDPEVILVGEIRDRLTAETVFQAALTGHLVLTTFHAGSAAGAVCRLSDMGIEPYLLRTGVLGIVAQRLVRKLCECSVESSLIEDRLGLEVESCRVQSGCEKCRSTGYSGRLLLAEFLRPEGDLGRAILSRSDADELESLAVESGMKTRWTNACEAVEAGLTSPAEVRRVFGFSK